VRPVRGSPGGEERERMGAGVPRLLRRSRGSTALAVVTACWLAAPASAAGLPVDVRAPAAEAVAPSVPVPAVTVPDATPVAAAVQAGARDVERVVAGAAGPSTAGGGAPPAVDAAVEAVSVAPPSADSAPSVAAPRSAGPAARAARRQPNRRAERRARQDQPPAQRAQADVAPAQALPGTHRHADPPSVSRSAARADTGTPEPPSSLDPLPAGASAAGASLSLLLGGLAVLLTAFLLAGPALRHRLPGRPALCWPAAFVPLLERPG
jgi:hypothetical protein